MIDKQPTLSLDEAEGVVPVDEQDEAISMLTKTCKGDRYGEFNVWAASQSSPHPAVLEIVSAAGEVGITANELRVQLALELRTQNTVKMMYLCVYLQAFPAFFRLEESDDEGGSIHRVYALPQPAAGGTLGKDKEWADMTEGEQKAAQTLGYDAHTWDTWEVPAACNTKWLQLAAYEQTAAQTLGYHRSSWDKELDAATGDEAPRLQGSSSMDYAMRAGPSSSVPPSVVVNLGDKQAVAAVAAADVAAELEGRALHKQLQALLLQAGANGLTTSKLITPTKLGAMCGAAAKKRDINHLNPGAVLANLSGLRRIGKTWFHEASIPEETPSFAFDDSPQPPTVTAAQPPTVTAAPVTVNTAAAIDALRAFAHSFHGRVWPSTKAQIKAAFSALYLSKPVWLMRWLEQERTHLEMQGSSGEENPVVTKSRIKVIHNTFTSQFQQLGVLSGSNKSFKWNQQKVSDLLNANQPSESLGVVSLLAPISPTGESEPRPASSFQLASGERVELVESLERLNMIIASDATLRGETDDEVAVDCEGVPEALFLIQLATKERTLVIDGVKLGEQEMCEVLAPLFSSELTTKLLHDLHKDAAALATIGGVALVNCLDSQLAMELVSGALHMGFNEMLGQLNHTEHPSKVAMKRKMGGADSGGVVFSRRPLPRDVIEYAAMDVTLLRSAYSTLTELLGPAQLESVKHASGIRAHHAAVSGGRRRVCIDVSSEHSLASRELLEACRPEAMQPTAPLVVSNDVEPLLTLLPADIAASLDGKTLELSDIVLDKGRRPQAWCAGSRIFLGGNDRTVLADDIDSIVDNLGGFGSDNRAGLEAQLHRVSAIRNRADAIIGLTMRVGRHVGGNAAMIADLLFHEDASLLFLGEPGSGKTTIVREATRLLAEMSNVLIVDTSNEIAGDGDVPHPCVGLARRLQVQSLDDQCSVMIEGVQNHTPEVMVIDEIGRPAEVEAARTCKTRGVRMIASAHGDLRKLLKNKQLRGLVGGVEAVTLGDAAAKDEAKRRGAPAGAFDKVKAQRAGPSIFDVIIELRRGEPHEWRIVMNSAKAVDEILLGSHYLSQRRTRDPASGEFFIDLEKA